MLSKPGTKRQTRNTSFALQYAINLGIDLPHLAYQMIKDCIKIIQYIGSNLLMPWVQWRDSIIEYRKLPIDE